MNNAQLSEASRLISALKATAEYPKVPQSHKHFPDWVYSNISVSSDRDELIETLNKLALSAEKAQEIMFFQSRRDENSILILSKTPETMQACAASLQSALVQLQTIIAEDREQKHGVKPTLSFGANQSEEEPPAVFKWKPKSLPAFLTTPPIETPQPVAAVPKTPAAKKAKQHRDKKDSGTEGYNAVIIQSIGMNCREVVDGDTITYKTPTRINADYAAGLVRGVIKEWDLKGLSCTAAAHDHTITITAASEGELTNFLNRMYNYSPNKSASSRE